MSNSQVETKSQTETNFCFPIKQLSNSRMSLEPFDPQIHAQTFVENVKDHPELFDYLPYGPFLTTEDFDAFYKTRIQSKDTETLFAVLKKSKISDERGDVFAGLIGLLNGSRVNATVEIGFITVLPAFQRSFVASNAIGLLLLYILDPPPDGLGLRRCQWQAHAGNEPSRRVATKVHFTFEGVQRFQRVLPSNKVGNGFDTSRLPGEFGHGLSHSRDSAVFAHYCDEWPEKRKKVMDVMDRR